MTDVITVLLEVEQRRETNPRPNCDDAPYVGHTGVFFSNPKTERNQRYADYVCM